MKVRFDILYVTVHAEVRYDDDALKCTISYMMRYDFIHDTTGYATRYDTIGFIMTHNTIQM